MSKIPLVVDTDVFGDPDDILAICYLLANQELVDVKLIVTADEHRGMRAAWLQTCLSEVGITIPVVAGTDLGNTRLFVFEDIATNNVDFDFQTAIKKVVESVDSITYLCLAPQSNLAAFLTKYPHLQNKITVRAMGAVLDIDLGRIEHNIKYDIASFETVAKLTAPQLLLADHTWHDSMQFHTKTEIFELLEKSTNPLAQVAMKNALAFFQKLYPQSRFHDPILVSTLFADFVQFIPEKIIIESTGLTRRAQKNEVGIPLKVSSKVDYEGVYSHFFTSLKKLFS